MLFAGDLVFNGGTPFVLMGSVAGSARRPSSGVRRVRRDDDRAGPRRRSAAPSALDDGRAATCGSCSELAAAAEGRGLPPLEAAREADLAEFAELLDAERIVGNLHRAYAELDGAERGAPIDIVSRVRRHDHLQRRRPAALPRLSPA